MCRTMGEFKSHFREHLVTQERKNLPIKSQSFKDIASENVVHLCRCIPCDQIFNETEIRAHRKMHRKEKCKICEICGGKFKNPLTWRRHLGQHEGRANWRLVRVQDMRTQFC